MKNSYDVKFDPQVSELVLTSRATLHNLKLYLKISGLVLRKVGMQVCIIKTSSVKSEFFFWVFVRDKLRWQYNKDITSITRRHCAVFHKFNYYDFVFFL